MQKHLSLPDKIGFIPSVLAGVLSVLSMFAANSRRLSWGELPLPLAIGAIVGLGTWGFFWLVPVTRRASTVLSTILTFVVMLWTSLGNPLIPVSVVCFSIGLFYTMKNIKKASPIISIILSLAVVGALGQTLVGTIIPARASSLGAGEIQLQGPLPDIYFIVPDRFCSPAGLGEMGYDPSGFVKELQDKGFYVNDDQLSLDPLKPTDRGTNTTRTLRFMASVLNMGAVIPYSIDITTAGQMVKYSEVADILKANGYTYYHIGSWWEETAFSTQADVSYVYNAHTIEGYLYQDEFTAAVMDRSILRYLNIWFGDVGKIERARQEYQLQSIEGIAANGASPKFVFMHLLCPHPPFIWTADGQPQTVEATKDNTLELYQEQVKFTEGYLMQITDSIKDPRAVIIIQSDEGLALTGALADVNLSLTANQWNGVFTAWRVPGGNEADMAVLKHTEILKYVINLLKR